WQRFRTLYNKLSKYLQFEKEAFPHIKHESITEIEAIKIWISSGIPDEIREPLTQAYFTNELTTFNALNEWLLKYIEKQHINSLTKTNFNLRNSKITFNPKMNRYTEHTYNKVHKNTQLKNSINKKCYKCNKYGHLSFQCESYKTRNSNVKIDTNKNI